MGEMRDKSGAMGPEYYAGLARDAADKIAAVDVTKYGRGAATALRAFADVIDPPLGATEQTRQKS